MCGINVVGGGRGGGTTYPSVSGAQKSLVPVSGWDRVNKASLCVDQIVCFITCQGSFFPDTLYFVKQSVQSHFDFY